LLFLILCRPASAQTNSQQLYLQCLTNFETYAETIWTTAAYSGAPADAGYWGDGGAQAGNNGGIRGNGGVAVAYAVLCLAYPNDPKYATRLARVRQALNYNTATHFTGGYYSVNGYEWGWDSGTLDTTCSTCTSCSDWQSAEWAGSMGLACILLQSNLPAATVAAVQRVIASEATHRASMSPCTLALSTGDTKAEENGWDSNPLALAAAWMTSSNSAATWLTAAQSYLANIYTVSNTAGDPLASWVSTVTLFPEFALENHGFYHPTYEMVAGMSAGDSLLMARLAGTNAAQLTPYANHNVQMVWTTNLSDMLLDSGEFAYPSGLDWELHDYEQNSYITWMAAHFNDPTARWADAQLAQLVRCRQNVNSNGMFVGVSGGGFYREAVEARRTAIAWLQWANADYPNGATNPPAPIVSFFPDVQVIAQRSPWGFVSLSYNGAYLLSTVEAAAKSFPSNTYVATPALPGGMGGGGLGDATAGSLVSFATNSAGFTAQLLLQNGANGYTRVYVNSCGEAVGMVEVPLPASGVTGTSAGCFTNGIEDDPLTGSTRLLEWSGGSLTVTNFSGVSANIASQWICVAGHYGFAAGPGGSLHYVAASGYNRSGAAQDYLNATPQTKFGPRYAVWFPSKNATQTASLAGQIAWVTNTSTATLLFPGNGATNVIAASLISGNGAWTNDANGLWSNATNWQGGTVASGTGFTADFSSLTNSADRTVTLDAPYAIGALKFGNPASAHNWMLNASNGATLTLSATTPSIAVMQNVATINAPLAGTAGLVKSGPGTLVLAGANQLSGTLDADSGSITANDGAFRIAGPGSVANVASPIYLRNNNGGSSTLQLDGSQGGITVAQDISLAGRNAGAISIQNLAGSNTLAGNFILTSGGGNYWFDSDAGTLTLAGLIPSSAPSVPSARTLAFIGAGNILVSGIISNANGYAVSLVKSNTGTLTLNGANTYSGPTTVYGGALAGGGVIAGPVTIMPGATLAPGGTALGTLTVNNALTNYGTVSLRLSKSGSLLTNDAIAGASTLLLSGSLQLSSSGAQLTAGDSFRIFSAANFRVFFTNLVPAVPGTNLLWNTNRLGVNGTLAVALGAVKPRIGGFALAGTNLTLGGAGGAAGYGFSILAATNLTVPITNWSLFATGYCDSQGNFTVTNGLPGNARMFYLIRIP
jgi:autotransporter-associated beta strand protein